MVTVLRAQNAVGTILFATGRGGNPARHQSLLANLCQAGFDIVAPHFPFMPSPVPDAETILLRTHLLQLCVPNLSQSALPLFGLGHSIGATSLLVTAGAMGRVLGGDLLYESHILPFGKLALLAPALDFFQIPRSMDRLDTSVVSWVGDKDDITPPGKLSILEQALPASTPHHRTILTGAGHFTFMNDLPPNIVDPHPDRSGLLEQLSKDISAMLNAE